MNDYKFFALLSIISIAFLFGCASSNKVLKPSDADSQIIESGRAKAKKLGLKPFPFIGNPKSGKLTIVAPVQMAYNMDGKWIVTESHLVINACVGALFIENTKIKRGQYARKSGGKLIIVE